MKFIDVELMQMPVNSPEVKSKSGKSDKKSITPAKKKKRATKKKKATASNKKKNTISSKKVRASSISKKRSSVKKTRAEVVKPKDILKSARTKLQNNLEKSASDVIKERMNKMAREVASESGHKKRSTGELADTSGAKSADALESYMNNIRVLIRENWAFTKGLAKKQDNLVTNVQFTVLPSGQIADEIWFEKRSGNSRYDQSAYNAVMKSNPLPPFPPGLPGNSLPVTMHFNLNELL